MKITEKTIYDACMRERHDYGLLPEGEAVAMRNNMIHLLEGIDCPECTAVRAHSTPDAPNPEAIVERLTRLLQESKAAQESAEEALRVFKQDLGTIINHAFDEGAFVTRTNTQVHMHNGWGTLELPVAVIDQAEIFRLKVKYLESKRKALLGVSK